jgi:cysteine synthase A
MSEMHQQGKSGSVVTLICDSGERYLQSYYNDDWVRRAGLELEPSLSELQEFLETGRLNSCEFATPSA